MICQPKAATVMKAIMDRNNLKRFMSHSLKALQKNNSKVSGCNVFLSTQIDAR